MGCGTGRVLIPTARAGVEIHGVDISADMLTLLRCKLSNEAPSVQVRVRITEGDITAVELHERFALVTAPFRVAQALLDRERQRGWLRTVRRHMAPGAMLCFDVFQPNFRLLTDPWGPLLEVDRVDPENGNRIRTTVCCQPSPEFQRAEYTLQWTVENSVGELISQTSASAELRWFTKGELENLLENEGFRITEFWGSFEREAFGPGSQHQVVCARAD
jgi:SAM-dependent methyltransferase